MTQYTIHPKAIKMLEEPMFKLFKHEGLLCCIVRMNRMGNINGYVAVSPEHPLYAKQYSDMVEIANIDEMPFNGNYIGLLINAGNTDRKENEVSIDMALNVHGGITYSREYLMYIDEAITGKVWWFGFDTSHAGDLKPFQSDIDRKYDTSSSEEYRDYEYVEAQCKQLADQLAKWKA